MDRMNNFNAGPAALPLEVLRQAEQAFVAYGGNGMSLMEMSHRSKDVENLFEETEATLLELLGLRAGYSVLFLGGGASMQFAMVPMNLMTAAKAGRYILSGSFSEKAYAEALTVGDAQALASSKDFNWRRLPEIDHVPSERDTAYVHLTTNNTIEGAQFQHIPDTGAVPLIGDMTSDLLSREIDFEAFAMFYASAQKNLGPAGATVVVIRDELLDQCANRIPAILNYRTYAQHKSLYNTPPVHSVYMMKLVLDWVKRQGGVAAMEKRNRLKAGLLYDVLDRSEGFYAGLIDKPSRSMMNITWRMADAAMEKRFLEESERGGFDGLAGHRSVGGLRASAYNAVSPEACRALADFMVDFQKRYG